MKITTYINTGLFVAAVILASCSGKQGDPGPQGQQGTQGVQGVEDHNLYGGSVEFLMTGIRKDGQPIYEPFTYPISASNTLRFITENSEKHITLRAYDTVFTANYIYFDLKVVNEGTSKENVILSKSDGSFYVSINKQIDVSTLLSVYGLASLQGGYNRYRWLSWEENAKYNFLANYAGNFNYTYDEPNDQYIFYTTDNKKVFFDGTLKTLKKVLNTDNTPADQSLYDLYNTLTFDYNFQAFFDKKSNANLSETEYVPADLGTISNYKYDEASGALSFNFAVTINGHAYNSTTNPLTVTGKYSYRGKIIKDSSARKGNG